MFDPVKQILYATGFYLLVIGLFRFSGKRLAGHTTTFDLVILISQAVAIQQITLFEGRQNALIFLGTVFGLHLLQTYLCRKFPGIRNAIRGRSTKLIENGSVNEDALESEGLTMEELYAGLRKAGVDRTDLVKTAHLEETGQISAVKKQL